MREQVITPRASARAGGAGAARGGRSGAITQKPARRGASTRGGRAGTLKIALSYMPLAGKILLAIVAGVMIFAGYRAAASASFFEARHVDVSGAKHASADDIKALVRRHAAGGVWNAKLEDISAEVERMAWVRRAVVSRVLPDGLRVRVVERVPRAVVRTSAGRFVWVDEDAVTLSQMLPADPMPTFFIRGWDESGTNDARMENRERIQKYLSMASEWESLGLSERVSEVNLGDAHDIRALLAGDDAHIEVRLGEKNFGPRLQKALKVLDEQRATPLGPFITYLVANQDGKITVGHNASAPALAQADEETDNKAAAGESDVAVVKADARSTSTAKRNREAGEREKTRRDSEAQKKKERERKERTASEARRETRPRRVG